MKANAVAPGLALAMTQRVTRSSSKAALADRVRRLTGAERVSLEERVQELWSGYGELWRAELEFANEPPCSVIVKSVQAPPAEPRDSAAERSRRRKLRSYEVEAAFYTRFSSRCDAGCRTPRLVACDGRAGAALFVLEDLDEAGFSARRRRVSRRDVDACLSWLAAFHATFLGVMPDGLWKVGCYWHLGTRPDELAAMADVELRRAAPAIDLKLRGARFVTLVHGDAKLENFCFDEPGSRVAAVDFQYVGAGVGVKDVAYFLSSCFDGAECAAEARRCLDYYFSELRRALAGRLADAELVTLEGEWRALYPYAWADFQRFLSGWAPAYARDSYAIELTAQVLHELNAVARSSSSA
ncbi:MAG: phosphotransferase [Polyangiaceae bacterium]